MATRSASSQNKKAKAKQQKVKPVIFTVNEKVLCYEPDPTKAKVLYDAKVLKVIRTEYRGKPTRQYLIHFQGWNSSWDRFVADDLVLKDNEANRTLQLELAEKAEALFHSSSSKSKRRGARTIAELVRASLKGIGIGETAENETDSSASEGESSDESDEDGVVTLIIPSDIRVALDLDYLMVHNYERLTELPAEPNIVQILEEYVKHFGLTQLVAWSENLKNPCLQVATADPLVPAKTVLCGSGHSSTSANTNGVEKTGVKTSGFEENHDPMAHLYNRLNVVKEFADGTRILVDFLLSRCLLYKLEEAQFERCRDRMPHYNPILMQPANYEVKMKSEPEDTDSEADRKAAPAAKKKYGRKRQRAQSTSTARSASVESKPIVLRPLKDNHPNINTMINEYKQKLLDWTLVPSSTYEQVPSYPSLIYGVNHLLRFFVKLPEILGRSNIPRKKLHIIIHHVTEMMDFITKKRFFGAHLYIPAEVEMKRTGRRRRHPTVNVKTEPYSADEDEQWKKSCSTSQADIKIKIEKP